MNNVYTIGNLNRSVIKERLGHKKHRLVGWGDWLRRCATKEYGQIKEGVGNEIKVPYIYVIDNVGHYGVYEYVFDPLMEFLLGRSGKHTWLIGVSPEELAREFRKGDRLLEFINTNYKIEAGK